MKKRYIITALLVLFTLNAGAVSLDSQIRKSIEMWKPVSITHNENVLKIISKERSVTGEIYQSMIRGICTGLTDSPSSLSGITEIRILNRFSRQGYVFEGGAVECHEFVELPASKTTLFVLGRTHLHTN